MASDVEAISDKAVKEAQQEKSLANIQATWDSIEFCEKSSTDSNTPRQMGVMVKLADADREVWIDTDS